MVSTKTQIAGFEFDNCLMNAAGVACMTIEVLEGVKNSAAGTFVTKTATLDFRQGNPIFSWNVSRGNSYHLEKGARK